MVKNLRISIFILTFVAEIVGGHVPMKGGFSTSPFSINKVGVIKKVDIMPRKKTLAEVKSAFREVWGDRYIYDHITESNYTNTHTKVPVECREHGIWYITPHDHLQKHGCPFCANNIPCTQDDFITKARGVHGDKYKYDKVQYKNNHTKVIVTCPIHGDWMVDPSSFLSGHGCPKCAGVHNYTTDEFIKSAKKVHGDKYDYSKVDYKNAHTKITITCNTCGNVFEQSPSSHLFGRGCPVCGFEKANNKKRLSQSHVIERMEAKHNSLYDYSKFAYIDMHTKGIILCPIHGEFWQSAHEHIKGQGCPCCNDQKKWTEDMFIKMAQEKFGNKFTYHHDFVNSTTPIRITCPVDGDFYIAPKNHLRSTYGCPKCAIRHFAKAQTLPWVDFIEKAKNKFGYKYDYSMISEYNYIDTKHKVPIICSKHGVFWQTPNNHLNGAGCPHCLRSLGEEKVALFLNNNKIKYDSQYKLINDNIFCRNKVFKVDFYIPSKNLIIEYNGEQHYKPVGLWGGEDGFNNQQERDLALRQYCKEHKINLIEIPYTEYDNIETILKKELRIK